MTDNVCFNDSSLPLHTLPATTFSLFLAERTTLVHFVRHAEGIHNEGASACWLGCSAMWAANHRAGDNTPTLWSTPGAEQFIDAKLTPKGEQQCVAVRQQLHDEREQRGIAAKRIELVVVSPMTRALQTAQIVFGAADCGDAPPFVAHDGCRERWGLYTCDRRRPISALRQQFPTCIDFDSFCPVDEDEVWTQERETDEHCAARGIAFLEWLAKRPERELAVVTHSSFLRHMFDQFGAGHSEEDAKELKRLAGNAELRSVMLCSHTNLAVNKKKELP